MQNIEDHGLNDIHQWRKWLELNHKKKVAIDYFESLGKSSKKGLLYWVISAKKTATNQKRILEIVENARNNMKPKPFR